MNERTNWAGLNKQLPKQLLRNLQGIQKTEKGYDKYEIRRTGKP